MSWGRGRPWAFGGACSNTALGCLRSAPGAPRGSGTPGGFGGFQARQGQGHQARVGQGHPHAQDARLWACGCGTGWEWRAWGCWVRPVIKARKCARTWRRKTPLFLNTFNLLQVGLYLIGIGWVSTFATANRGERTRITFLMTSHNHATISKDSSMGHTGRLPSSGFCVYSCQAHSVSETFVPLMDGRIHPESEVDR